MNGLEAFWLGIVQGLSEFLPVSSSGHLVMLQTLLGLGSDGDLLFEVAVHVASMVAILVVYRERVLALIGGLLRGDAAARRYAGKLALATLPAVALTLVARDSLEATFDRPAIAGVCLLVTAAFLLTTRSTLPRASAPEPGWVVALLIGCAQAAAILPGFSRSGATVAAALALGVAPLAAAEFAFLLGVVAITGAAVLMLPELGAASSQMLGAVAIGGLASLVSGIAAIWLFLRMLERRAFHWFAAYAGAAGAGFLLYLVLR